MIQDLFCSHRSETGVGRAFGKVGNHAINAIVLKDFSTSLQIKSFARGFNYNWFIIKEFLATESFRLASQDAMGLAIQGSSQEVLNILFEAKFRRWTISLLKEELCL